ncbi:hypothetical protein, partial [Treponema sp. R6D11]
LKGSDLVLSSTDRETTIIVELNAQGDDGNVLVSASLFVDIVRRLGGETSEFVLSEDGKNLAITSGKTKFDIPVMDPSEYPLQEKTAWDTKYNLDLGVLTDLINSTIFAAAPADSSNIAITGGNLKVME